MELIQNQQQQRKKKRSTGHVINSKRQARKGFCANRKKRDTECLQVVVYMYMCSRLAAESQSSASKQVFM